MNKELGLKISLIKKALLGDKKAQEEIFRTYKERTFSFILQRVASLEDAEEILQETFISAYDALPFYSDRSSLLTWILGIAKHEIADFYRKKKIKTVVFSLFPSLENFVSRALGPEAILEEKELKIRIKKVLGLLGEGYQEILRLKYIRKFSVREIAQRLDETEKAIESRLTRARKAFARIYAAIEDSQAGNRFF